MINIVHCVTDEKFIRTVVDVFDFLDDRCHSDYVYIESNKTKTLRYIADNKSIEHLNIKELMQRLSVGQYDVLFLHNLYSMPLRYISFIPSQVKVVWLAWGFDIYSRVGARPLIEVSNIYHSETKKLKRPTMCGMLKETGRWFYQKVIQDRVMRKAVARADYFSGVIPEEYDMMCHNSFFRAKPIEFRYDSPLSNITLDLLDKIEPVKGMNILVGNSGDPSNNHADIFKKLAQVDLGDRKIFVPLSYAGTPRYRQKVKELGERLWGNRFIALQDFIPYTEYYKQISSCGFRIFGHERQQAMGNVRIAFRDGCKVFLSETSIIYRHQTKLGLKAYTIQHDIENGGLLELPSDDEVLSNKKISLDDMLTSKLVGTLYKMIFTINNNIK
jgi:hypothetical protein